MQIREIRVVPRLPSSIFYLPDFLSALFGWKAGWGFNRERRVWPCSVEIGAGRWRQVLLNPPLWRSAIYRANFIPAKTLEHRLTASKNNLLGYGSIHEGLRPREANILRAANHFQFRACPVSCLLSQS